MLILTEDAKLYVTVVTLSTEDDNKPLQKLKAGFKKSIKWNKYRSKMYTKAETNKLNYLIGQHLIKSIDYLSCQLKLKVIEHLFQSIMHQKLK